MRKPIAQNGGLTLEKGNSLIGVIFTLSYCTILFFYEPGNASQLMVYCAAVLLGIGIAFNNVCAIVVVSDMIRPDQMNTAAFVHGFASLTDKIFTGVSVQIIQLSLHWINYRHVEVFIVGSLILIGGSLSVFDYLYWARPENNPQDDTKKAKSKQLQDEHDESSSHTHHNKNHIDDDCNEDDRKKVIRNRQESDPTSHCNGTSQTTTVNV
ncbi:putative MFS-type transporter C19orf28 [Fasciolopsis buskii]|uniref:Putative MFS-type transporter C19orf28 n=1 Tax=Fasciolopsis buskii TaxID=27845 RepID=A0A8E0VIM9_9TREM|nr:putative MFS-type transporter C19orf28 [Fasciolopsis buski]